MISLPVVDGCFFAGRGQACVRALVCVHGVCCIGPRAVLAKEQFVALFCTCAYLSIDQLWYGTRFVEL